MSTATVNTRSETPRRELPWRRRGEAGFDKPTLPGFIGRYLLLLFCFVITVGPFLWELSTSLKGPGDDIYAFPPSPDPG